MGASHSFRTNFSSTVHYPAYVTHGTDFIKTISRQTKVHRAPRLAEKIHPRWLEHLDNRHFTIKSEDATCGCYLLLPSTLLVGTTYVMKLFSKVSQLQVEGSVDSANRGLEEHHSQELECGPH